MSTKSRGPAMKAALQPDETANEPSAEEGNQDIQTLIHHHRFCLRRAHPKRSRLDPAQPLDNRVPSTRRDSDFGPAAMVVLAGGAGPERWASLDLLIGMPFSRTLSLRSLTSALLSLFTKGRRHRVGRHLAAPLSHTTVRTVPYTAVHAALFKRRCCSSKESSPSCSKK